MSDSLSPLSLENLSCTLYGDMPEYIDVHEFKLNCYGWNPSDIYNKINKVKDNKEKLKIEKAILTFEALLIQAKAVIEILNVNLESTHLMLIL